MGVITRDSILRAIEHGISADQIVEYLVTHAHPQARHLHPHVPGKKKKIFFWKIIIFFFFFRDGDGSSEVVGIGKKMFSGRIGCFVWQVKKKKKISDQKKKKKRFPDRPAWEKAVQFAKDNGVYIWSGHDPQSENLFLFISETGFTAMRNFVYKRN